MYIHECIQTHIHVYDFHTVSSQVHVSAANTVLAQEVGKKGETHVAYFVMPLLLIW